MKTRVKGNRVRRAAIEKLTEEGFQAAVIERTGKFIDEKDAFGIGDLLAIGRGFHDETWIEIIGVTCNRPHVHKPYMEFAKKFAAQYFHIEQWVWFDRKGWKIYRYDREGSYEIIESFNK